MSNFSGLATAFATVTDITAPATPIDLVMYSHSKTEFALDFTVPNEDSDGTTLTGLTSARVVTAVENPDGSDPFAGLLSIAQAEAVPNSQIINMPLTPADAGQLKTITFPVLDINKRQYAVLAVSD
jgi:hypothetical protein